MLITSSAVQVDVATSTYDWLTLAVTACAAGATLAAVLVALWPQIERWRRVPRVNLLCDQGLGWMARFGDPEPRQTQSVPQLWVTNERRRETARDVEVFLTLGRQIDPGSPGTADIVANRDRLGFSDPANHGLTGAGTTHIPSGFARPVYMLTFGETKALWKLRNRHDPAPAPRPPAAHAVVDIWSPAGGEPVWLEPGTYNCSLHVTGANFDALLFVGRFEVTHAPATADPGVTVVRFQWLRRPERYVPSREEERRLRGRLDRPDMVLGWSELT